MGIAWLKQVDVPATERLLLDCELRQLEGVERELESLDERLLGIAVDEPRVRLLMTLPGVSHVVAIGLLAALDDVKRFRDGNHAASYLGNSCQSLDSLVNTVTMATLPKRETVRHAGYLRSRASTSPAILDRWAHSSAAWRSERIARLPSLPWRESS